MSIEVLGQGAQGGYEVVWVWVSGFHTNPGDQ